MGPKQEIENIKYIIIINNMYKYCYVCAFCTSEINEIKAVLTAATQDQYRFKT